MKWRRREEDERGCDERNEHQGITARGKRSAFCLSVLINWLQVKNPLARSTVCYSPRGPITPGWTDKVMKCVNTDWTWLLMKCWELWSWSVMSMTSINPSASFLFKYVKNLFFYWRCRSQQQSQRQQEASVFNASNLSLYYYIVNSRYNIFISLSSDLQ